MRKRWIAFFCFLAMAVSWLPARCSAAPEVTLPIVMYHHMSPKSKLWGDYVISPAQFEKDLQYLRTHGYTAITTQQLIDWCNGEGELPQKPVMITFDDGFESTAVYAQPLLEKYQMCAVVSIIGAVAQQYTDKPDHMLDYSYMNWDQIEELEKAGQFEIQCHTYDMHQLKPRQGCSSMHGEDTATYTQAFEADIARFQADMKAHLGHPADVLALPFGFYCADTLSNAQKLGFRAAFTCTERVNRLTGAACELMTLCRFNRPSGPDSATFFSRWESA